MSTISSTKASSLSLLRRQEILSLNQTSVQLYRTILRSIQRFHRQQVQQLQEGQKDDNPRYRLNQKDIRMNPHRNSVFSNDHRKTNLQSARIEQDTYLLLQAKLDPRDYGFARTFSNHISSTSNSSNTTTQKILSFFQTRDYNMCYTMFRTGTDSSSNAPEALNRSNWIPWILQIQEQQEEDGENHDPNDRSNLHPTHSFLVTCQDLKQAVRSSFLRLPFFSSVAWKASKNRPETSSIHSMTPTSSHPTQTQRSVGEKHILLQLQRHAIQSLQLLDQQVRQYNERTSITCDWERGIQIIATSQCIGGGSTSGNEMSSHLHPSTSGGRSRYRNVHPKKNLEFLYQKSRSWKNRFAYRIRIEKMDPVGRKDSMILDKDKNSAFQDSNNKNNSRHHHPMDTKNSIQILGRTWNIIEHDFDATVVSKLSQFSWDHSKKNTRHYLKEGENERMDENHDNDDDDDDDEDKNKKKKSALNIVSVDAPSGGVVGHLPVLQNGQIFEYMSGCELSTNHGSMGGCLHMAWVDPETKSAQVGDPIEAFLHGNEDAQFKALIHPFGLVVDD